MLQLNFIFVFWLFTQHAFIISFVLQIVSTQHLRASKVPFPDNRNTSKTRPLGFGGRYSLSLNPKEPSEINLIKFLIFKVILDTLKGQTPNTLQLRYCIFTSDKKILCQSKLG